MNSIAHSINMSKLITHYSALLITTINLKLCIKNRGCINHPIFPSLIRDHAFLTSTIRSISINAYLGIQITISKEPLIVNAATILYSEFRLLTQRPVDCYWRMYPLQVNFAYPFHMGYILCLAICPLTYQDLARFGH